ncbi:MAG: RsmD family RNA methyltransferase [Solirubrobacterales bacterium]
MRITGGELRGRRLYVPKTGIRPTAGRVREAVFSMLGGIDGAKVLDLFCGSGALGIEALSRGAADATFVDIKPGAVTRNLDELGISGGEPDRGWIVKSDVLDFLEREVSLGPTVRYDLVLCDPPYRLAAGLATGLDVLIPGILAEGGRVVIETTARNPLQLSQPLIKDKTYGDTLVRVYAPEPVDQRKEPT